MMYIKLHGMIFFIAWLLYFGCNIIVMDELYATQYCIILEVLQLELK